MAYKNKNLEKSKELLEVASQFINNLPNKGITYSDNYRSSYELVEAIHNFLKSLDNAKK